MRATAAVIDRHLAGRAHVGQWPEWGQFLPFAHGVGEGVCANSSGGSTGIGNGLTTGEGAA